MKITPSNNNSNSTAYQRYLPTGPLAVLPLWDGFVSIVWSLPVSEARRVAALSSQDFLAAVNHALSSASLTDRWSILDEQDGTIPSNSAFMKSLPSLITMPANKIKQEVAALADAMMAASLLSSSNSNSNSRPPALAEVCSPRVSFPLSFTSCSSYVSNRVALMGDAAHSIHPQAGQGLNLGLADAKELAARVSRGLETGEDIGDTGLLRGYHQSRYVANLAMMTTVDVINSLFSDHSRFDSLSIAAGATGVGKIKKGDVLGKYKSFFRSVGMLGVHSNPYLKGQMAKFAMGE